MKTDTGKQMVTSTGSASTGIQTLASGNEWVENPSTPAQTATVDNNSCETLAELLSLIQDDLSKYKKALAPFTRGLPVSMKFDKTDGIIYMQAPPGHELKMGTGKYAGHILLDGRPVTGWSASAGNIATGSEPGHQAGTGSDTGKKEK